MNFFVSSIAVMLFSSIVTAVNQTQTTTVPHSQLTTFICCPNEMCVDLLDVTLSWYTDCDTERQAHNLEFAALLDVNAFPATLCARQDLTFVSTSALAEIFVTFRHMARLAVILFYDMGAGDSWNIVVMFPLRCRGKIRRKGCGAVAERDKFSLGYLFLRRL